MTEEEYQKEFNAMLKYIDTLLRVTGNDQLRIAIKKRLFDFSDFILEKD